MTDPAVPFAPPEEALNSARAAMGLGLCAECFGRLFGRLGHGLTNPERAERLAPLLGGVVFASGPSCPLCGGAFDRIPVWVERIVRASEGYEWHRFTCGSRWEPEILAREEEIRRSVGTGWGESARAAFNRELGKRVEARTGAAGGSGPADIVYLADLEVGRVEVTVLPLYLRGRYRKLDRSLPQTRWPCRACHGRGCERCHGTGKTYSESVEEIVAAPALRAAEAETSRFHGMGREDIDARMLGRGRPFVLELVRPRRRSIDPAAISAAIAREAAGRVEVSDLVLAEGADVIRVKEASPEKSYRVTLTGDVDVAKVKEALKLFRGRAIAQRTPTRVSHRRADRVRTRRIVEVELVESGAGRFTVQLRTEAGTYVKEGVEGDGGRTDPSLSGVLGVPLKVEALDVLEIHDTEVV